MGLFALLKELFVHHAHMVTEEARLEGHSGSVYTVPILAECESGAVIVAAHDGELAEADVDEFCETVHDVGAERGVLVHLGPSAVASSRAGPGVVLWDRGMLAQLLGEMQVAQALGETAPPLVLDNLLAAPEGRPEPVPEDALAPLSAAEEPAPAPPNDEPFALPDFSGLSALLAQPDAPPTLPTPATPPPPEVAMPAEAAPGMAPPEPQPPGDPSPLAPGPPAWPPEPAPPRLPAVPDSPFGMLLAAAAARPTTPPPPPTSQPPLAPHPAPAPSPAPSFDWAAPASSAAHLVPAAAQPPAEPRTYGRPLLPVRVSLDDARRKVRDRLYSGNRTELVLHPVYLFDYECDVLQEGKLSFDTEDGRLQVHGSDKSTLDLDPDQANPEAPGLLPAAHDWPVTERVLRVADDRAQQLAVAHVIKRHTRTIDVRIPDENHSLFYMERRKVEPKTEQVRLACLGVFFRPVWRLHGDNGYVDVDAVDGRELDAQLIGSRHGALVLE